MKKAKYLIIDLGNEISVCSSLFLAKTLASSKKEIEVYFFCHEESMHLGSEIPSVNCFSTGSDTITEINFEGAVDFTEPGSGVGYVAELPFSVDNYYIDGIQMDLLNGLTDKANFISSRFNMDILFGDLNEQVKMKNAVMTYSASLAANLNLQGIPTIELCSSSKKYGSFLPGSLVIIGDESNLKNHDDLKLIFGFYKEQRLEDLFVGQGVLEVQWQLVYYKYSQQEKTIVRQSYPVSPTEQFIDLFFRNFLVITGQQAFSVDQLMEQAGKMDYIDLEVTMDFLRKSLQLCIEDLEEHRYPLAGSYWSLIHPYVDCDVSRGSKSLHKRLRQALIGMDMLERIQQRHRKVLSMH